MNSVIFGFFMVESGRIDEFMKFIKTLLSISSDLINFIST